MTWPPRVPAAVHSRGTRPDTEFRPTQLQFQLPSPAAQARARPRMTKTPPHVIFGTGAVGRALLAALTKRGETVRMVNTSGVASVPADVEVVGGNAADPAFSTEVAQGARVVSRHSNPRTRTGRTSSRPCRQGCWPRRRGLARGWSAWSTCTCTARR